MATNKGMYCPRTLGPLASRIASGLLAAAGILVLPACGDGGSPASSAGSGTKGGSTAGGDLSSTSGSATSGKTTSGAASTDASAADSVTSGAAAGGAGTTDGGSGTTGGSATDGVGVNTGLAATGVGGANAGNTSSGTGGANTSNTTAATTGTSGGTCSSEGPSTTMTDLAFPQAEGFGQHATGGRDGSVVHVTNLNDAGAGSFRDAVSQPNRIVVFDVGGYIALETAVSVKSNITIAGQTAPGEGIGFRGGEISFAKSSNIICRYIRIRPGDETESSNDDALSLYRAKNVIVDHTSLEFGPWNNIDAVSDDWQNSPVTDVTFQDNIIANPTGQQFGAHTESVSSQWSWYRNIFANSHNRNPLAKINNVFVNNVLYNCQAGYTTHTSTSFEHDILNNYFILGPGSGSTDNTWYQIDKNQSIYYSGNLKDENLNGALDGATTTPYWYQGEGTVLDAPWSTATNASTVHDTLSAYRIAVSLAGTLPRDPIDALVISQVRTLGNGATGTGANTAGPGGGLYTSQDQTGLDNNGYGAIAGGSVPTDTDNDGMPDFWEQVNGSNPSVDDAMQKASDGYALIEHYLNWLAEPRALTSEGQAVDVDLSSYALGFGDASPVFSLSPPACGSVEVLADGHTARFTPNSGFVGLMSFGFSVMGSDGSTYSASVVVAVQP